MNYISTRGGNSPAEKLSAAQVIKKGIADDGGLYMPEEMPDFTEDDILKMCGMDYPARAAFILSKFLTDYSYDELSADCEAAYCEAEFPGGAAPVVPLNRQIRMLELWHGPTAAFKDMALQLKPKLLSRALSKTGEKRTAFILAATSGDTGKAALEGYSGAEGVKIMVFYPVEGVSNIQKLQMATQEGKNVAVCAVKGNFDDTQNGVKKIFSNAEAVKLLNEKNYFFSSANSINWGRLVPQIAYYISAYCDMINNGDVTCGGEINVCVPTGNFGNILAAYLSKECGMPFKRFICASNANNVLTEFFKTGTYNRKRPFYTTTSPSMDILISSNLERLLYLTAGSERTSAYMKALGTDGAYTVDRGVYNILSHNFTGDFCDETNTAAAIKRAYFDNGYLCDTHTAVGIYCAENYINYSGDKRKILITSTASPYKFASDVYKSLTGKTLPDEFKAIEALSDMTKTPVPIPLKDIEKRAVRFTKVIEAQDMLNEVLKEL